ncbi:MAG: 6-carboxytetrahydropterin synthase [Phycisphaeraceae bacterium]|nr:6-carboxytetrahydropterin synthase [Phycisphaeraceae bacterium]
MPYRICKSFEIESGHMLSKHPGLCRFPHGHSRRVDVVLVADALDGQDMVCDFKTLKLALGPFLARFDHAMLINSADAMAAALAPLKERVVALEGVDPTTEVLAEKIYRFLESELRAGRVYRDEQGLEYRFPQGARVERVRVTETSSSWAEYEGG